MRTDAPRSSPLRTDPLRIASGVGLTVLPLALAAVIVFPSVTDHAAPVVLLAGLVAGVPHGAFDHRVASWSAGGSTCADPPGSAGAAGVAVLYLMSAPVVLAALLVRPAPTLTVLLVLSVAHFAEGEAAFAPQRDGRSRDRLDRGAGWSIGLAMVGAPLLAHPVDSVHLLRMVTGWSPALPAAPSRDALLAGLVAGAGFTTAALVRAGRRVQAVEVALTVLLGMVAPPGVAFGVSFAAVHSAHHLGRLTDLRSHRLDRRAGTGASLTGSLLPLAVTAAGGVTCWAVTGTPAVRVVLGAILALTVPHAIVVAGTMDGRRWSRRDISAPDASMGDATGSVADGMAGRRPTDHQLRSHG